MTLGEYAVQFANKYNQYLEQLAEAGRDEAERGFAESDYEGENSSVDITTEKEDMGFRIIASGEAVSFMEFGTGVYTGLRGNANVVADYGIYPGSWSENHKKMFSTHGYWIHDGKRYIGTVPAGGMQNACLAMQYRSSGIAKGVFG